jgi:hypothetical protein
MKPTYVIVFALALVACTTAENQQRRFIEAEVKALELDSTKLFRVETDSLITWDINPFLKKQPIRIDEMVKSVFYIPLETNEESLIKDIKNILVTDSHIYVADYQQGGRVVIFDSIGKYVGRLLRGSGPEELRYVNGITFDEKNKELIAYDGLFFSIFSSDGQLKRRIKTPFFGHLVAPVPEGYLFWVPHDAVNEHLGFSVEFQVFITDKNFRLTSVGLPYYYGSDNRLSSPRYLHSNDSRLYFTTKFSDTIYQYVDPYTVRAKYCLDYSSKKLPNSLLMKSNEALKRVMEQNNYYYFLGGYVETSTHSFVQLTNHYAKNYTFIFRDKQSGALKGGTSFLHRSGLLPLISAPICSKGSYFIGYCWPELMKKNIEIATVFVSEKDKQMLENLQEDDNPVLIFYELKHF